ncbi:MAG: hypothetical protein AAF380_01865, partial [Bacteroidota bacterium]
KIQAWKNKLVQSNYSSNVVNQVRKEVFTELAKSNGLKPSHSQRAPYYLWVYFRNKNGIDFTHMCIEITKAKVQISKITGTPLQIIPLSANHTVPDKVIRIPLEALTPEHIKIYKGLINLI